MKKELEAGWMHNDNFIYKEGNTSTGPQRCKWDWAGLCAVGSLKS